MGIVGAASMSCTESDASFPGHVDLGEEQEVAWCRNKVTRMSYHAFDRNYHKCFEPTWDIEAAMKRYSERRLPELLLKVARTREKSV